MFIKKIQKKEINFIYHDKIAYEMNQHPEPAKNFIPLWYKEMTPYQKSNFNPSGRSLIVQNQESNATAKKCTPMLDGISSGYIVPLWCDVQVRQEKNIESGKYNPIISWRINRNVFQLHGPSSIDIPAPFGYDRIVFKFLTYFRIQTPAGYSIMVTNPFGHYNLPFYAIPAVIDSDRSVIDNNFPCWIQEGFEGVIEKGTPIAQVTPFKRTNWKMKTSEISTDEHIKNVQINFESNIVNNYRKNIWSKKIYS